MMKLALQEMTLKIGASFATETAQNYRPPSWPPPPDWPVVIDKAGAVVSRWGDPEWDLTPWGKYRVRLVFGDAREVSGTVISTNGQLLRQAIGWLIWAPRGYTNVGTIKAKFGVLTKVFSLCNRNGIVASRLQRFPHVLEQLLECIAPSHWNKVISVLHSLYDAHRDLGFTILDASGLKRLASAATDHETVQAAYIPPRIWEYQVERLQECLEDFMKHSSQIESCFNFCIDAYVKNFKTLEASVGKKNTSRSPFTRGNDHERRRHYVGPFTETAQRFGIEGVIRRWVVGWDVTRVAIFSLYLSLVTYAGQLYIANFTLQRREEVGSLRADCLVWEDDVKLGRIALIRGETTKTDPDSDARWVTSPRVELAVRALSLIARLRMKCDVSNPRIRPSLSDVANPYLASSPTEPWGMGTRKAKPYDVRGRIRNVKQSLESYSRLFDEDQMRITSEDLKIARRVTPNLPEDTFAVGLVWPLAWHQYRRTTAVNMMASGFVSNSTLQQVLKQLSPYMPLYYGRGHTRLMLNEEVEQIIIKTMYEGMALRLQNAIGGRYISPHSASTNGDVVVNLLTTKDLKELTLWARDGKVSFRENRLGGCMQPGPCEYGGFESIARCGGGDGNKPCADVRFDREREKTVRSDFERVSRQMENLSIKDPRYSALAAEQRALENYLSAVADAALTT